MAGDKRIDAQDALLLGGLIDQKHPRVMIAYTNYTASQVWYGMVRGKKYSFGYPTWEHAPEICRLQIIVT